MNLLHSTRQPLDCRQLRAFVALAKTGSFTRAGKELFISQSAVSHSIKGLESDIGCRLFDRMGKKVHLTPAGEHLLHHAEKILREMAVARESIEQRANWGKGRLRIGASPTICQYLLPSVIREFRADFPEWQISIEPGDTSQWINLLREGRIDLAIALAPQRPEPVDFKPLFMDELSFLVAPAHPWAHRGNPVRDSIPDQNFILYSKTSYTFRLIQNYFQREHMALNMCVELASIEAIKELVKLNIGVGILAPWVARKELEEASLLRLPLGRKRLRRTWGVLRPAAGNPTLGEETLTRLCRKACAQLDVEVISEGDRTATDLIEQSGNG